MCWHGCLISPAKRITDLLPWNWRGAMKASQGGFDSGAWSM
jgi:hypothetical protein